MMCQNCGTREGTENWGGTYDAVSLARDPDLTQKWCEQCVLEAQISHIEEMAERLPDLKFKLMMVRYEKENL